MQKEFIISAIAEYIESKEYSKMLENEEYYKGNNPKLERYFSTLEMDNHKPMDIFAKIRVPSGIFNRLITLLVNRLWYNGVQLDDDDMKTSLGENFDYIAKNMATNAAVHGVCYGFWNYDQLVMFAAKEYFSLKDERTDIDMAGIRFWQIAPDKPWVIQLFESDGYTEYTKDDAGNLTLVIDKRAYKQTFRSDILGTEIIGENNYIMYPVIALYANKAKESELTEPIKKKIDLYDTIMTTFGDQVLRTKAIYWILEGMSGNEEHLLGVKEAIERLGIIAPNSSNVNAKAETLSLPYEPTMNYLKWLKNEIFSDAMIMDPSEVTGGSLTNVAINTANHAETMKVSDMEWLCARFVEQILTINGMKSDAILFKHKTVSNDMEISQRLAMYSDVPIEFKLMLDPLFPDDIVESILDAIDEEALGMGENVEDMDKDAENEMNEGDAEIGALLDELATMGAEL